MAISICKADGRSCNNAKIQLIEIIILELLLRFGTESRTYVCS